ncbi:type II toxin-antitoxin system VapC family toxin [Gordonia bronchialis]|uniref:type II toxin-antitoxin system VapC family toxin n=1 Tax=Gordonia bronchialis TaxID=2054 RepID=UPI00226ED923|nr:type II toxin-antitoxin system VapC family toxin [Gordonia bronchialis]
MTVLDASAVLAMLNEEPGADVVTAKLAGATMSVANLAEVLGKVSDVGADMVTVERLLRAAGVTFIPLDEADARMVAALRRVDGGMALSLGDRCCLALALRSDPAEVLTADQAWRSLDLPLTVQLLR